MKIKAVGWAVNIITVLALALGSAEAQPSNVEFHGVMNDFTSASAPVNGPWEVRGPWSLTVNTRSDKANFSAALTMERSDLGVTENAGAPPTTPPNPLDNPMLRMAHTHHITLRNGEVTRTASGFQVVGRAIITKDGSWPPPFETADEELPTLTLEITGSTSEHGVIFSNITVMFGDEATMHFGMNPLHGVIRSSSASEQR